ncbi:hypothetical protein K458DRAFT_243977, partial [Lentithecium fluviatile CBS 122367]
QITAGTTPSSHRTWHLPTALLSQHSTHLRNAATDPSHPSYPGLSSLTLPTTHPSTFQTFIDYMYSNIYSQHKRSASYHPIHSHASAWILGFALDTPVYKTVALRCLYNEVVPLALDSSSGVLQSPIRPSDIEFVCKETASGCVLRALLFDAVAAHWKQSEVLNLTYDMEIDTPWLAIYNTYPDFRTRLSNSLKVGDAFRYDMLRPVDDYVA